MGIGRGTAMMQFRDDRATSHLLKSSEYQDHSSNFHLQHPSLLILLSELVLSKEISFSLQRK